MEPTGARLLSKAKLARSGKFLQVSRVVNNSFGFKKFLAQEVKLNEVFYGVKLILVCVVNPPSAYMFSSLKAGAKGQLPF